MTISPVSGLQAATKIVSPTAGQGNYTTIQAAITAASSGETILIKPGTYTESVTLKAGVNLTAFGSDGLTTTLATGTGDANVIILGSVTASFTGSVCLSGLQLRTNGAAALITSGSNVSELFLSNCSVFANDATGMTFNNSNCFVTFFTCYFLSSSTNAFFANTVGPLDFEWCVFVNSGTPAASTTATSRIVFNACDMAGLSVTTSGTGNIFVLACMWQFGGQTLLTTAGTGSSVIVASHLASTTASTISIGAGTSVTLDGVEISSSNTNAITGAGTLFYGLITFLSSSSTINTSTQTALPSKIGTINANSITFGTGNALSNYVEGTFTPVLAFGGASVGITYNTQTGVYQRIGNKVTFSINIILTNKGSSTGSATITGLPITTSTANQVVPIPYFSNITLTALYTGMAAYNTTTTLNLIQVGSGQAAVAVTNAMLANNSILIFSGEYFIT